MRITSNLVLKGDTWVEVTEKLKPIINTVYGVYVLSAAIGIHFDKQIDDLKTEDYTPDDDKEINLTKLRQENHTLDLLFKSALITTENVDFSEDLRLELAFNDDAKSEEAKGFNHIGFLTKFANYGVTQIAQKITDNPLENMEVISKYIADCVSGISFDELSLDDYDIDEDDIGVVNTSDKY